MGIRGGACRIRRGTIGVSKVVRVRWGSGVCVLRELFLACLVRLHDLRVHDLVSLGLLEWHACLREKQQAWWIIVTGARMMRCWKDLRGKSSLRTCEYH